MCVLFTFTVISHSTLVEHAECEIITGMFIPAACRPCHLTGTMHHTRAKDELEKEQFAKQAATDWEKVLLLRARELAPGRILCYCVGCDMKIVQGKTIHIEYTYYFP